jgi:hypothetical protein
MGSSVPKESSGAPAAAPESLARLVLQCRELAAFLDGALATLPAREETPFLYGQLDDVLQRLQASLRPLLAGESSAGERSPSFLRRLAGKKPREPAARREPRYDLQGNAWTIPVTELVGFLSHSGKSGLLWVTSPSETFVLEFARGNLVHATSNAPPVAHRLGEILLAEGLLEAAELAEVIDYAKAADDLLGSYLVRTGRLQHADLQRALAMQVQQLFHRLMDAENALYRFQEGAQLLRSQGLEVNITQLLLESARKKDEERIEREGPPTAGEASLVFASDADAEGKTSANAPESATSPSTPGEALTEAVAPSAAAVDEPKPAISKAVSEAPLSAGAAAASDEARPAPV